jgi:hypothetical protein
MPGGAPGGGAPGIPMGPGGGTIPGRIIGGIPGGGPPIPGGGIIIGGGRIPGGGMWPGGGMAAPGAAAFGSLPALKAAVVASMRLCNERGNKLSVNVRVYENTM